MKRPEIKNARVERAQHEDRVQSAECAECEAHASVQNHRF